MANGDVSITLDGQPVTLRCTLRAATEVTATFGSYTEVYRRLASLDHRANVLVVAAGLGKDPKDVEGQVYRTGLHGLVKPLTEYITLLSNGGRPPRQDEGNEASGEG